MNNLKNKILLDINEILFDKNLNKSRISIFSMKIYYHISNYLKEICNNKISHNINQIYNISALCADNIECIINNLFELYQLLLLTDEEIYKLIHNIIITNVKYY